MKYLKPFFLFAVIMFSYNCLFSNYSEKLPNYILAENSNFIVNFINVDDLEFKKSQNYTESSTFNSTQQINRADYTTFNKGVFDAISFLTLKKMELFNLHPAGFISTSFSDYQNEESLEELNDQMVELNPGFVINIMFKDLEKVKNAFLEDKLNLKDVKIWTFTIGSYGEMDATKIFALLQKNMSLESAFDDLSKLILKKPDSYFIKQMDIDVRGYIVVEIDNNPLLDLSSEENNNITHFIDEKLLRSNEILIMLYDSPAKKGYQFSIKQLEKYYPYKYILVDQYNYKDFLKKGYKYIMIVNGYISERIVIKKRNGHEFRETEEYYRCFYVIKNMETSDVYYGGYKPEGKSGGSSWAPTALRLVLKRMKEHYNWE